MPNWYTKIACSKSLLDIPKTIGTASKVSTSKTDISFIKINSTKLETCDKTYKYVQ